MKTEWHPRAESAMHQIADYIQDRFGAKEKKVFLREVRQTVKMLHQYPYMGSFDPIFDDRTMSYRSIIISGLSKMVYYIDDDTIHIAAFWDPRREPQAQAQQVKGDEPSNL